MAENDFLRSKATELEDKLKNVTYEMDSKLEDKIDELNAQIETLTAALTARLHNVKPGDVFFIESQEVANGLNYEHLMSLAKSYGCNFIAGLGLSKLQKMTEVELEQMNLRRIEPGERATALQKLEQILKDIMATKTTAKLEVDESRLLEYMASGLSSVLSTFKEFELKMSQKVKMEHAKKE